MKNCLLITVDSLRFDHFTEDLTPTLRSLADRGVSFKHAFATGPGTTPSFPALLTGTLPLSFNGLGPLTSERPRIAKQLAKARMATAGFQCNPFLSNHFNYDSGFTQFEDYQNPLMGLATKIFPRGIELNNPTLERIDNFFHITDGIKRSYQLVKGKPRPYVSAEVVTDDAVTWLEEQTEGFFCWTHYMDVHHPCYPPTEYRDRFGAEHVSQSEVAKWYSALLQAPETLTEEEIELLQSLYRASILYTDNQIKRLVRTLERTGQLNETLVVITSDHGELFGEHGGYGKPERMYDELLQVPLVVVNGSNHLKSATDDLISLLDVPPLIHDALEIDVPSVYEGRRPGVDDPRLYVLAEHEVNGDVVVGARSKTWLFEGNRIRDERCLFDLRNGFEAVSLDTVDESADAQLVQKAVTRRLEDLNVERQNLEDEMGGDLQDRLENLGYL